MLPEVLIRNELLKNGIQCFSTLDGFEHDEFCILLRTSSSNDFADVNRKFKTENYDFQVQCFSRFGRMGVLKFSSRVAEILEDIYWRDEVSASEVVGGNTLPTVGDHDGESLGMVLSIFSNMEE